MICITHLFAEVSSLDKELSDLTTQWSVLYQSGDIAALSKLYTPDCRVLIPNVIQKNGREGKNK